MTQRMRITTAALVAAAIALSGSLALADHADPNPDAKDDRCDTWWRSGHESGTGNNKSSHGHTDEDFDQGETGPVYIHNHTGHYVVRGEHFYIEVVGGGAYQNSDGNQGGYVQGEVDVAEGAPDVDFHVSTFAGTGDPANPEANACVSVADNKVGDQGTQP